MTDTNLDKFHNMRAKQVMDKLKKDGRIKYNDNLYKIDEFFSKFMMEMHDGIITVDDFEIIIPE